MSQLLKRTKKSCLKLLRKLSTKQIFVKRLEEDDITPDNDCTMVVEHVKKSPTSTTTTTNHKQKQKETTKEEEEEQQQQLSNINVNTAAKYNVDENCNQTMLQTLTTKFFHNSDNFEFKRLPSNHNDAVSEIIPYEVDLIGKKHHHQKDDNNDDDDDDDDNTSTKESSALTLKSIVFAKMNYKQNVRYLRHTPSSTSLENSTYPVNCNDDDNDTDADDAVDVSKDHLACNASTITNQTTVSNAYTTMTTTTSITTTNPITTATATAIHTSYSTNGGLLHLSHNNLTKLHKTYQSTQHLPVNVSLGSKSNGNYQQLIISEEPDYFFKMTPIVKWDINGNSLEDESSLWLNFENLSQNRQRRHLNGEQQQQQQQYYHNQNAGDNESCKSSYRSSSSTLYTWLEEDDSLDSVNSHLLNDTNLSYPKRCLI